MRAMVFSAPGDLKPGDWPLPEPGPGEVTVELDYCGICPWDVRAFRGLASGIQYPRLLGHEAAGRVARVGAAVKSVGVGQAEIDVVDHADLTGRPRATVALRAEPTG